MLLCCTILTIVSLPLARLDILISACTRWTFVVLIPSVRRLADLIDLASFDLSPAQLCSYSALGTRGARRERLAARRLRC